jgi:SAM-dependent methyltransferase
MRRQYATDKNLRTRQDIHANYTVPDTSYVDWVIARHAWQPGERVLDAGCGPGLYYPPLIAAHPEIHYTGIDLLDSMLANHPAHTDDNHSDLVLGDVQRLPFKDNTFDVVMAHHILHHVPDVEVAVIEMKRVLKPSGVLISATNSVHTMPEFQFLMRRAIVLLTRTGAAQVRAPEMPTDRYALENGTRILSRHFFGVVRHDLPNALVFPDVEPAMTYLESTRELREAALPEDVIWDDVMMIVRQQIRQLIKHMGELVIKKQSGVLVASNKGGFISQFAALNNGASGS